MSKSERLTLIAMFAKMGKREVLVIAALPSEIREEVDLTAYARDDESIIDVDTVNVPSVALVSQLADSEHVVEARAASRHEVDVLTPTERKQLANDLWRYRHPILCWLVPADFFAKRVIPA